jgi:hypothetical protein
MNDPIERASRVVTFLQRTSFFANEFDASKVDVVVVRDPLRALEYANKLNHDDESYEDYVELLETEYAKVKRSVQFGVESKVSNAIFGKVGTGQTSGILRVDLLNASLSEAEKSVLDSNFDYEIVGCAANLNSSKPSKLYDQILAAFEAGGIPCGWMGKFPKGKLIVFLPLSVKYEA